MIPPHRSVHPAVWGTLLATVVLAACGPSPGPTVTPVGAAPGDTSCEIAAGPTTPRDSLIVALTEPVDAAHAPVPRNNAERLVFRQLYETLVQVDCQGRIVPGLAGTWSGEGGGRRWTFTLREDARFWDGAPVGARDVAASWAGRDTTVVASVTVVDQRTLTAALPRSAETVPPLFADPALAVRKPAPDRGWPIGTGAFWVSTASASADAVRAAPLAPGRPPLVFRQLIEGDLRDALDVPVDLLVTDDVAVLDYAGTRDDLVSGALPWNRAYALLLPARIGSGPEVAQGTLDREGLWRAVRSEARAAIPPYWWEARRGCETSEGGEPAPRPAPIRRRVAYQRGDATAQELADRLVALGALGSRVVAVGLAPREFASARQAGTEWAYVVSLPRQVLDPCRSARRLLPADYAATVVPLVDVRSHAVVRRGAGRLTVDFDGALRFAPR